MFQKTTFVILLNFLALTSVGQNIDFDLLEGDVLDFIEKVEKIGGELIPNTSTYYNSDIDGLAQPIKYELAEDELPNLLLHCFYFEADSSISYLLYEWDVGNFTDTVDVKPQAFQENMINSYLSIVNQLEEKYSLESSFGDISDLSKADNKMGMRKIDKWEKKDNIRVESSVVIFNYQYLSKVVKMYPTYRIRCHLYIEE